MFIPRTHTRTKGSSGSTRKCSGFQALLLLVLGKFLTVGSSSASTVGGLSPLTSACSNCLRSTDTPCASGDIWEGGLAHWYVLPTPPLPRVSVAKQQMTSVPRGFRLPRGPLPSREPRERPARRWVPAAGAGRSERDTRGAGQSPPVPTPGRSRSPISGPPQAWRPARPGRADSSAPRLRALRSTGSGSAGSEDAGRGQRARGEGDRRAGGRAPRGVGGVHVRVCACV